MASAVENLPKNNDSVVYEHIIPRSVRQKWIRRSSVGSLDQEFVFSSLPATKEPSMDTDLVSHDAHLEGSNTESNHITEEEEIAVFNAWGVKLRHIKRQDNKAIVKEVSDVSMNTKEKTEKSVTKALNSPKSIPSKNNFPKSEKVNSTSHNDMLHISPKVVESSVKIKRERPKSMPVISAKKVNDNNKMIKNSPKRHSPPKAYKSPHAKVPWKRPVSLKKTQNRSFDEESKINGVIYHKQDEIDVNFSEDMNKIDVNTTSHKQVNERIAKEERIQSTDFSKQESSQNKGHQERHTNEDRTHTEIHEESQPELLSVSKRRKSFETSKSEKNYSGQVKTKNFKTGHGKGINTHSNHETINGNFVKKSNNDKDSDNIKALLNKEAKSDGNLIVQKGLTNAVDEDDKELDNSAKVAINVAPLKSNNLSENKLNFSEQKNELSNNDKSSNNADQFPRETGPIKNKESASHQKHRDHLKLKASKKTEKNEIIETSSDAKVTNSSLSLSKDDVAQMPSEALPVTTTTGHKRRVGSLTIQSGDIRERQFIGKKKITASEDLIEKKGKQATSGMPQKKKEKTKEPPIEKSAVAQQCEIPVTNLDDISINTSQISENTSIPVTNLDEMPSLPESSKAEKPHLDLGSLKSQNKKKEKTLHSPSVTSKHHFCPIKKVNYNEARELITPKVYFEKPVGLKSVLSPKTKKQVKKKVNVSFSADDLEKVHIYPSETAAMEIYDEANKDRQTEDVTNIDDVLTLDSPSGNLSSYIPSGLTDLTGTLEREREKFSSTSNTKMDADFDNNGSFDVEPLYSSSGDLFTESTNKTASAMLF